MPKKRTLSVRIPAGIADGQAVRIRGEGEPPPPEAAPGGEGGRGDLHVVVNVVVPSKVSKRERELLQELDEVSEPAVLPKGGPSIFDWLRDRLFG